MANNVFGAIALTGGGSGALDDIDGNIVSDGDSALVFDATNNILYSYTLDASSGAAESSPEVISPDSNAGNKRWILLQIRKAYISGGVTNDIVTIDANDNIQDSGILITNVGKLNVAAEWSKQQNFDETAITSSGNAVAWDLDDKQCAYHLLTENTTISAPTNMNAGACYILRVKQAAASIYTLAWNAVFDWGAESAPGEPATVDGVCVFAFYSDGSKMYGIELLRDE